MATAQQRIALGAYGERVAARHLTALGMTILDRNWHCRFGELDLVLRDRDDLVICEVKTRRGTGFGHPLEAVGPEKLLRLRRSAALWVEHSELARPPIRIDLVAVQMAPTGPPQVEHVIGVG